MDEADPIESPDVRGFVPFLVHNMPKPAMRTFTPVWRHLVVSQKRLLILTAPQPPSTPALASQAEEAKLAWRNGPKEIWAAIPYGELTRVTLHGGKSGALVPRLVIQAKHWKVSPWQVDYWNNITLVFGTWKGWEYDRTKVALVKSLLPRVLPSNVPVRGF